jgi:hypothetical protein
VKLSKLQKFALATALNNHISEGRNLDARSGADVFSKEIIATFYGFPTLPYTNLRRPGGQTISRTEIGPNRYEAAHAAVSRALRRLVERNLLRRVELVAGTGWSLTSTGLEIAQRLGGRPTEHSLNRSREVAA